jgi:Bacterial Ig domain
MLHANGHTNTEVQTIQSAAPRRWPARRASAKQPLRGRTGRPSSVRVGLILLALAAVAPFGVGLAGTASAAEAGVTPRAQVAASIAISRVRPRVTPPSQPVTVAGNTGSCNHQATLAVLGMGNPDLLVPVTGDQNSDFLVSFLVPKATFPTIYTLQLRVDCRGDPQQATDTLTVVNQAPAPADDTATTILDTPVTIDVTANDRDPDGEDGYPTSLDVGRPPAHGTAGVPDRGGTTIVYTPDKGFAGQDQFGYRSCDLVVVPNTLRVAGADCGTATVTVTVTGLPRIVSVSPNPTPPNRQVTVVGSTGSCTRQATLTVLGMGTPNTSVPIIGDQAGTFQVAFLVPKATLPTTYTLQLRVDCHGDPQQAEAALTVINHAPVAADDTATTTQDTPVGIAVAANDTDPDGEDGYPTSLQAGSPAHGTTQVPDRGGTTVVYTPDKGFAGQDQFSYRFCDLLVAPSTLRVAGRADCGTATVTVTVTGLPRILSVRPNPTPPNRQVTVAGNTGSCSRQATLAVLGMGNPDLLVAVTGDQSGNFRTVFAVPKGSFPRPYTLQLRVDCHGRPQQAQAALQVINHAPVAIDDAATTSQDTPVGIAVTANDRDPDGDDYETLVVGLSPPPHGSIEVRPDTTVRYAPDKGFVGQDQFQYSNCDNTINAAGRADCGTATVTVTVTGLPRIVSVRPNPTPPNRQVTVAGNTGSCSRQATLAVLGMGNPDLLVAAAGDQSGNFRTVFAVPKGSFPRPYQLQLRVDCHGRPQQAQAALTVINHAPVAADDTATTTQDTPVGIAVTANDTDPDGDDYETLVVGLSPPTHGTIEVRPDDTVRYGPDKGFVGQDQFQYSNCDNTINAAGRADCGTATVTVTVTGRGVPPIGQPPIARPPTVRPPAGARPNCVPSAGDVHRLRVTPDKGTGGARLRITATLDRRLAACPLRLLLGGARFGADMTVSKDGTLSTVRNVPADAAPGTSTVRLASIGGQILAETPFEILAALAKHWWQRDPLRLLVGGGAFLLGVLGRAAIRRWRLPRHPRVRVEPHPRPPRVTVEQDRTGQPAVAIRLQPHADVGTVTTEEVAG